MARTVRGGLIQVKADVSLDGGAADIKQRMIDKHLPLDRGGGAAGRPAALPAGALLRPVLLRRAAAALVRAGRADPRRPDDQADAGRREEARHGDGRADLRRGDHRRLLQHRRGDRRRRHVPRQVPQEPHPARAPGFWEKFYFRPGNLGYPVFDTAVGKVGVYICYDRHFPEGRAHPRAERRRDRVQSVGHRRRAVASISGSSSSRRTPSPTATSSARSTASASKRRGTSASSTARATSAIRAASSSPKAAATRTSSSSPTSIST